MINTAKQEQPVTPTLPRDAGLRALADKHGGIADLLPAGRRVIYLDYAFTTNVGDQLIVLGTLAFFERYGVDVKFSRNLHNIEDLDRIGIGPDDIIVLHGGGNFGDIYPHFQRFREAIVRRFATHRIVIMPQTVHFADRRGMEMSCRLFAEHPDLTLFVRDRRSLALMEPYLGQRAKLMPDMAHQLWPGLLKEVREKPALPCADPLFLIRRDVEEGAVAAPLRAFEHRFTDWEDLTSTRFKISRKIIRWQYPLAKQGLRLIDLDRAYFATMRQEIIDTARLLDAHPVWLTSRMHGAILGILLGKPIFALDNSYGKLSSYFEAWAEWIKPARIVSTDAEIESVVDYLDATKGATKQERWAEYLAGDPG